MNGLTLFRFDSHSLNFFAFLFGYENTETVWILPIADLIGEKYFHLPMYTQMEIEIFLKPESSSTETFTNSFQILCSVATHIVKELQKKLVSSNRISPIFIPYTTCKKLDDIMDFSEVFYGDLVYILLPRKYFNECKFTLILDQKYRLKLKPNLNLKNYQFCHYREKRR